MAKRKDKWREWGINVCSLLDKALINLQAFPTAIIKQAYEIIISKF